jgi:hypothetical protein
MSSPNPSGTEKYWLDGSSYDGLIPTGSGTGTEKYWLDGMTIDTLIAPAPVPRSGARSATDGLERSSAVTYHREQSGHHRETAVE